MLGRALRSLGTLEVSVHGLAQVGAQGRSATTRKLRFPITWMLAVLALAVVAQLATVAPARAAGGFNWIESAPLTGLIEPGTHPTGVLFGANADDPRVFFVSSTDHMIHDLTYTSASGWVVGPARSGEAVAPNTSPAAVLYGDGGFRIYYVAASSKKIREAGWDPTRGWGDVYPSGISQQAVATGTSPAAINIGPGQVKIYYVASTDNRIRELHYAGGWVESGALSLEPVEPNSSPTAFRATGTGAKGGERLYYVGGTSHMIREVYMNGTSMYDSNVTLSSQQVEPGTSPSAVTTDTDTYRVYYVAKGTRLLRQVLFNWSTGWSDTGSAWGLETVAQGTSPSAINVGVDGVRVYYTGTTSHAVREAGWNAASGVGDVYNPLSGLATVAPGYSPFAMGTRLTNIHVYYPSATSTLDTTGRVRELAYAARPGWSQSGPIQGTPKSGTQMTAVTNNAGDPRVFFVSSDNKIHDLSLGSTGYTQGPARSTDAVATGSSPAAIDYGDGGLRVYYVSAVNNRLREAGWDPTRGWGDPYTSISALNVASGTSPAAVRLPGVGPRIYYVAASDMRIHEVAWGASGWSEYGQPISAETVAAGSTPSAVAMGDGGVRVYYVTAANHFVREAGWDPTRGYGDVYASLAQYPVAAGTSVAAVAPGYGAVSIYYLDTNRKVRVFGYTPGPIGWTENSTPLSSAPAAVGTSPSAFINGINRTRVDYVSDTDKSVHELLYKNENHLWSEGPAVSSAVRAGFNPVAVAAPNGSARVYTVDDSFGTIGEAYSAQLSNWGNLLLADLDPLTSDPDTKAIFSMMPVFDRSAAETVMRTRTVAGDLVKSIDDNKIYVYTGSQYREVTPFIGPSGIKRTTSANITPIGPAVGLTEWACGGGDDRTITTTTEINCAVARVDATGADGVAAIGVLNAINVNRNAVELALATRLTDGTVVRELDAPTAVYLNYAYGQWRKLAVDPAAVGYDSRLAKWVTIYGVNASGFSWGPEIGAYPNSWAYGGANRTLDTSADLGAAVDAAGGLTSAAQGTAFRNGFTPNDLARLDAAMVQLDVGDVELSWGTIVQPTAVERAALGSDPADDADAAASAAAGYPKRGCRPTRAVHDFKADYGVFHKTVATIAMNGRFCWDQYKHTVWQSEVPHLDTPINVRLWYGFLGYTINPATPYSPQLTNCLLPCTAWYTSAYGYRTVAMAIPFDVNLGYGAAAIPKFRAVDVIFGLETGQAVQHYFERPHTGAAIWHPTATDGGVLLPYPPPDPCYPAGPSCAP